MVLRLPARLVSVDGVSRSSPQEAVTVEATGLAGASGHRAAWADLARRALEPDIFLDPLFALPAARRFAPDLRPTFLLVWTSQDGCAPALIGLCPVPPLRRRLLPAIVPVWTHEQAVMAAPLLDGERAVQALDALLGWLRRTGFGRAGLLCRGVPRDGPLGAVLTGPKLRHASIEVRTRAVLARAGQGAPGGKRAKEWRRQHRRLLDRGPLAFRSARDPDSVRLATEYFLLLEASGWKGRRGTALAQDPALALFTRALTGDLARDGRCRIESLELDGRPIAMGIVLRSRDRAYFWKTAFDESFAALSPGKQFALALTTAQREDPRTALTDSCALPDHPMIDRLWPERMTVADVIVATSATSAGSVTRAAAWLRVRRRCRALLKTAYLALRARLR